MSTLEQQALFSPFLPRSRTPNTPRDTPRLFLWRKQAATQTKRIRSNELCPIALEVNWKSTSTNDNFPVSPISSFNQTSSNRPSSPLPALSRSSWLQSHAQKGLEAHIAEFGSVDDFVRQDTPRKNTYNKYHELQVGAQRSLSTSEPHPWSRNNVPFVFCPWELPEESTNERLSSGPRSILNSHLDPVPRNEIRLSLGPIERPAKVVFGETPRDIEAEVRAWLDEVSSAMVDDEDERPTKVVAAVIDERPGDIVADVRASSSTFLVSLLPRRFPFSLLSLFFRLLSSSFLSRFPFPVSLLSCRLSLLLPCVFVVIYLRLLDDQSSIFVFCKVLPGPCSIVELLCNHVRVYTLLLQTRTCLILGRNPVNEPQLRELLFVSRNERS